MELNNKHIQNRIGKCFKTLEVKEFSVSQDRRIISGYAAIFNNKDKAGDILIKGCFSKSIQERGPESEAKDKIILLWMHEIDEPIGHFTKLIEDDKGLYFEAYVDDIDLGNRAIAQMESGTLNQFSIGYKYVWENCEYDEEHDAFIVKEVVLYEISVVSIGCNGETEYLGLKSIEDKENALELLQKEIDEALLGLSFKRSQELNRLFAKAISLATYKPDSQVKNELVNPLVNKQAEKPSKESIFDKLIFIQK